MKKVIISVLVVAAATFTSCEKGISSSEKEDLVGNATQEEATVQVRTSDYERRVVRDLVRNGEHSAYTSGVIEYLENGTVTNRIEFNGERAERKCGNEPSKKFDMVKKKKKGEKYDKVIVEPIVKSEDCKCPVAGTVEFFKKDQWVATVDFGDGTCDDIATKTTAEGEYVFEMDCNKKGKKDGKKECKYKKYIYEPLVKDASCDCIVAGKVKIVKCDETVALIDFGDGTCDDIATKTVCVDGDCEDAAAYTEDFQMECDKEFEEGEISASEAQLLDLN